jgi:hypothetical protein
MHRGEKKLYALVQHLEEQGALDGMEAPQAASPAPHGFQKKRLEPEQTVVFGACTYGQRLYEAQIVPAAMTLRHRIGITRPNLAIITFTPVRK